MNFTPGPWCVRGIASRDMYVGPADDGGAPAVAIVPMRVSTRGHQAGNASLVAAAPKMAEALDLIVRRLQADIDDGSRPDQWSMEALVLKARAALPAGCVIGGAESDDGRHAEKLAEASFDLSDAVAELREDGT
jgi:hypothetical protein